MSLPKEKHVVFARVGWMTFYDGQRPDDEKPKAGGKWNKDHIGHEVFNFKYVDGKCLGHFEPPGKIMLDKKINLGRIAANASGDSLKGVLVVFVARKPGSGGQIVVGWYRNAMVFSKRQLMPSPLQEQYGYYVKANYSDAVLLPLSERKWRVSADSRSFGQSNVCYQLDINGHDKKLAWQKECLRKIFSYEGDNLLDIGSANVVGDGKSLTVKEGAQGFAGTALQRREIEILAMKRAIAYFDALGYSVEDVHSNKPYDLYCANGNDEIFVEVKGTTTPGAQVILTKNEVRHVELHPKQCVLYVLSNIAFDDNTNFATGGEERVIAEWSISTFALTPLHFLYSLPETVIQL